MELALLLLTAIVLVPIATWAFDPTRRIPLGETGVFAGTPAGIMPFAADQNSGLDEVVRAEGDLGDSPEGSVVVAAGFHAPIVDITWQNGWLYLSHNGMLSRIHTDGTENQALMMNAILTTPEADGWAGSKKVVLLAR